MTGEARLGRLERRLTPIAAVCRWLDHAHGFGSIGAYLAWATRQPRADGPVARIVAQVGSDVARRPRSEAGQTFTRALADAKRDALLRIAVVFELNEWTAGEIRVMTLEQAFLLQAAFLVDIELGSEDPVPRGPGASGTDQFDAMGPALRGCVAGHAVKLLSAVDARTDLERDYLGGHAALFPDLAADWQRLVDDIPLLLDSVSLLGPGLAPTEDAHEPASPAHLELSDLAAVARARAPAEAAVRLAEARIKGLMLAGDNKQAGIAAGRLLRRALQSLASDEIPGEAAGRE